MAITRRSLTRLHRLRKALAHIADEAATAILGAWAAQSGQLNPSWVAAAAALAGSTEHTGRWPSAWQVARIPQVSSALIRTRDAAAVASAITVKYAVRAAEDAVAVTLAAEPEILAAQIRHATAADFSRGITQDGMNGLYGQTADRMAAALDGINTDITRAVDRAVTHRPTRIDAGAIAGLLVAVFGQGGRRASITTQTETMDAARAASAYVGQSAGRSVAAWMWRSDLGPRTCPACWSMHGTLHPLREAGPHGHTLCRCGRLLVAADPDSEPVQPDAVVLFRQMPRADQLKVLGPTRLQLLDNGDIQFADLAVRRDNTGWRPSYTPRTVADLLRTAGVR